MNGQAVLLLFYIFWTVKAAEGCTSRKLKFDLDPMKGRRLLNHTIASKQAESETWCRWFCLWDNNCVSINYNDTEDSDKQHLCELNDSDKEQHPEDLKEEKDFSHYGTKNPCSNRPCGENGLCQTGFGCEGYRCICKAGYSGQACEKDINECDKSKPCHPNAKCTNTPGSYECKCNAGYEGNGKQCGVPPSFTKVPENITYWVTGENATIECNASGVPKPTVEWTRLQLPFPQGRSQQQDGRLSISAVQLNDSGNYTCKASNELGFINTTTEFIAILPVKVTIEDIESSKAVLSIDSGPWPAYIIELTNRQNMNVTEFRQDAQRGNVTQIDLTNLDPDTLYSVRVRPVKDLNQLGKWSNETLFKTPGIPPSFTKTPKKRIFLLIGRNLTIECSASGVPKPTVKWTGSLLGPTQVRRKQQDGRLSIRNVQIKDSGNYTCEISNKEGVVNTTTELVVAEYYFSRSDSVILSGHPDYEQKLNEYLEPVQVSGKQWKLCYRASEHNYRSAAFHTSCNRKGATVTLVRVGIYVFGGYADKSWDAPSESWRWRDIYSDKAFLFSLKNHLNEQFKMFTYRNQQYALYNRNSYGPVFGGNDLRIAHHCDVNTDSYSNLGWTYKPPNGYTYYSPEASKLLAGSEYFKCDEYEVFYQE